MSKRAFKSVMFASFFWLALFNSSISAQINGLSATKMAAFSAEPAARLGVEFEPNFVSTRTAATWEDAELIQSDSIGQSSSLFWRMTYGLSDDTEVGFIGTGDFTSVNVAVKHRFVDLPKFGLSAMSGLTIPLGNRIVDPDSKNADDITLYGIGLVSSWYFSERAGLDLNVQYQNTFNSKVDSPWESFFMNADYAYYIADNTILLVFGTQYQATDLSNSKGSVFSFLPGVSFEMNPKVAIAINTQHDLFGKRSEKTFGFNLAITTFW